MTNTILTLHDPAAARRHYAEGLWRGDTLYALLRHHAARRPDAFALRDGARRLTWRALLALGRCGRGRSPRGRSEARRARRGVAAEPRRDGRDAARLLAQRLCLQPVAAPQLPGRRDRRLLSRIRAAALVAQPGYGADARDRRHLRAPRRRCPRLRRIYPLGAGPSGAVAVPARPRPPAAARRQSRQDRLSRLHLRHDRQAQGRAAFRQHAARQRPRHGRGLAPRRAHDPAEPEP